LRAVAAEHADGLNVWAAPLDAVQREGADLADRARRAGRTVALTWGGQVLLGSTPDVTAARLAQTGERPGLVHGTPQVLARFLGALDGLGVSWAVLAPVGTPDDEAIDLAAEAAVLVSTSTTDAGGAAVGQ
jgi:alkanesulfonate monooxygenase SsuD/methylene tetrahydromethanopterin reductase-like flavin-dependent oxidoreductase (luciferase family)